MMSDERAGMPSGAGTRGSSTGPRDRSDDTPAADAAEAKRVLRRKSLVARRGMSSADVGAVSQAIAARLLGRVELQQARTVLLYVADADEVDLSVLIDTTTLGFDVLLPRVEGDRIVTVGHVPGEPLVIGSLGVREPMGEPRDAAAANIDVAVVPGVAFSPTGGRLGRGRGLYDRLLPQLAGAVLIGVCAERFVVNDLPLEAHDVPMDLVVSEAAVRPGPEVVRRRDAGEPGAPT